MRSLSRGDFRGALDFLALLGEAEELEDFGERLVAGLHGVIGCCGASYNEVNMRRRRIRWISDIGSRPCHVETFERHMPTNPVLQHQLRYPESDATTNEDLMSARQWRELGLYRDLYGPLRLEHLMFVTASLSPLISVALFRDGGAFSERDRSMLSLLRPHIAQAYRNAAALGDLKKQVRLLEQGISAGGFGTIRIDASGKMNDASDLARTLLFAYFGPAALDDLPQTIRHWLTRSQWPASEAGGLPDAAPLIVSREDSRLVLRLVRDGIRRLILLKETRVTPRAEELRSLGLARRESEILALVASGKTDTEISRVLSLSPRTVSHTLERVYRKLGVTNRAGAVARIAQP